MLEENPNTGLKNVILKIILIILILFILVWLFPTKQYVVNQVNKSLDKKLDVIGISYNGVFNENIKIMKDGAISYFTSARLPKDTGDTVTLTLKEMLDRHLIVKFKDADGESCDSKESYVEVTKEDNEYIMKVNLACDKQEDYILVHMGDYDYCTTAICEKKKIISENTASDNSSCEYIKYTDGTWSDYGEWSNWTPSKISKTNYNLVETKTVKEKTNSSVPVKKTITKEALKTSQTIYSCPSGYYKDGTKCSTTKEPTVEQSKGQTVYVCSSEYDNEGRYTKATYQLCKKTVDLIVNVKNTYTCSSDYDNAGEYSNSVTCKKTVTYNKHINSYKDVTYYRSRTKKCVDCKKDIKWGNCDDMTFINKGYSKTGNTK